MKKAMIMLTVLAVLPAGAMAQPIFHFGFTSLTSGFDGVSTFTTAVNPATTVGTVGRDLPPASNATFVNDALAPLGWTAQGGNFGITMNISNITATTALGTGSFIITDIDGDTITGTVSGTWTNGTSNQFAGVLGNVAYNGIGGGGNTFNGHVGSFSTVGFPVPPWNGTLIELSSTSTWFADGAYSNAPASVDADVVPAPAAALLGMIGLGLVGWVKRRWA